MPPSGDIILIFYLSKTFPTRLVTKNTTISTATIVEPTGVPPRMETIIPKKAQTTDKTAEHTITALNRL